jgi:protein-disulfide isomerase
MRQNIEQMVVKDILDTEAKAKGVTTEEYLQSQVKLTPPSDEEIQKVFDQSKERMPPGTTLEQVKPQISAFLEQKQQQKAVGDVIAKLRKDHHVKITLPQKRKDLSGVSGVVRGDAKAPVTLVEFSDFQCPFCGRAYTTVEEVMKNYAGKVKLEFVQFPLPMHENAEKAAEASLCAKDQGKFWALYDLMFKNQTELQPAKLKDYAKQSGLDTAKFDACLDGGEKAEQVKKEQAMGEKLGVQSTPTFFVNGLEIEGAQPYEAFAQAIDDELANSK